MADSENATTEPRNEFKEARKDFLEKISVAGWKEAFGEEIVWIRNTFMICLLALLGAAFFYTHLAVVEYQEGAYKDEITDFVNIRSLPFSNVTVCAQVYFNETVVRNSISIPDDLAKRFMQETGEKNLDQLYRQYTLYLSLITRPRKFSADYLKYFWKITYLNPSVHDYAAFIESAVPPCERVLKKCSFDGVEFDCCASAVRSIEDDGICYLLMLNFDSDNAVPSSRTFQQTRPGPAGGLSISALLSTNEFPTLENDADNGFKVYVNAVPIGLFLSPMTAAHGSTTHIQVKSQKRFLAKDCAPHGRLIRTELTSLYHDPEGVGDSVGAIGKLLNDFSNCRSPVYGMKVDNESVCSPHLLYIASYGLAFDGPQQYNEAKGSLRHPFLKALPREVVEFNKNWATAIVGRKPLKHCARWTYETTGSFFDLEKAGGPDFDGTMYSEMKIYYSELAYRQYEETKQVPSYLAFCNFGNAVGLCLGMSIISFFHVLYYAPRYLYVWNKWRVRRMRVFPAAQDDGLSAK